MGLCWCGCVYRAVFYKGGGEGRVAAATADVGFEVLEHVFMKAEEALNVGEEGKQLLFVEAVCEAVLEADHLPERLHVRLLCGDDLAVDLAAAHAVLLLLLGGLPVLCRDLLDVGALPAFVLVLCDRVPAHLTGVLTRRVFLVL